VLANAIYALEADGKTTASGLRQDGMRYGWNGKLCHALKPGPADAVVTGDLVDPASC
jgi:hypothetical protein